MNDLARGLQVLLDAGVEQHLFSGAAAGISSPAGRFVAYAGTHADDDPTAVAGDSLFDLASVTKTFTAATAVRLAEQGRVDLDAPVRDFVDIGRGPGAGDITLRMLLTHVSGLPAECFVWKDHEVRSEERIERVLTSVLESPPGAAHRYSCVGYIAAGAVLEAATGTSLADLVDELVSQPLRLGTVGFAPIDAHRAVATEAQPWDGRGVLRGEVHDELSRSIGGRVGNAGLFANIQDVLTFAESFVDDRHFSRESLRLMTTDQLSPRHAAPYGQGLGPRVGDADFVADPHAFGHTGFTGTMWFVLPEQQVAAALLTNRVHPHRDRVDLTEFRRRFSAWVAANPERKQ